MVPRIVSPPAELLRLKFWLGWVKTNTGSAPKESGSGATMLFSPEKKM